MCPKISWVPEEFWDHSPRPCASRSGHPCRRANLVAPRALSEAVECDLTDADLRRLERVTTGRLLRRLRRGPRGCYEWACRTTSSPLSPVSPTTILARA